MAGPEDGTEGGFARILDVRAGLRQRWSAMARGGLSSDPEKRAAQLARLEAGRKIAAARREAGLPTKRRESRGSADDSGQSATAGGSAKVRRGDYAGGSSGSTSRRREAAKDAGDDDRREEPPRLNRAERAYARILGYPVE